MPPRRTTALSGWGRFPIEKCVMYRPEKQREIAEILRKEKHPLIARGAGKSYGDSSLNPKGVIACERLDRFLSFDAAHGIMRVQAGVTLADILHVAIPRGWILPVIPGTKFATAGGSFASNVHGKNHFKDGDFAAHVTDVLLRLPGGETAHCSAQDNSDLYWATAGGMGMTGVIEEITLKLKPIASASVRTWTRKVTSIEEMTALFREHETSADYMVGWIDHFAKGEHLGRGVFEKAEHANAEIGKPLSSYRIKASSLAVPRWFPGFLMNRYTMWLYNTLRFAFYSTKYRIEVKDFESFFHPLDGIRNWNYLYGRKGFLQYQCVIPEGLHAMEQMRHILQMIQESGKFSYLAVIKYHRAHEGIMSFPIQGFSLALDFPNTTDVHALLHQVDHYLCGIGGRVYLAKDARLSPQHFEQMYAHELPKWRKILKLVDPKGKMNSSMAQRLGFREKQDA